MGQNSFICQLLHIFLLIYLYLSHLVIIMIMLGTSLPSLLLVLLYSASAAGQGCCKMKVVGGATYTLLGEEDTSTFSCLDKCTYKKEGEADSKYCFAEGDLQTECKDTAGSPPATAGAPAAPTTASAGGAATPASVGGAATPSSAPGGATTTAAGCKCGKKRTSRIVGGSETEINEYPWMAVIATTAESQFCGGSLIGSQWVITATHCMFKDQAQTQPQTAADIVVVLGEHDLFDQNESKLPRKVVKVSQIIKHEHYDKWTFNNDIALLKLAEEVDLLTYTPVCLPKTGDIFVGRNAWVYGWGSTSFMGAYPTELLEVEVTVVSKSVCRAAMPFITITDAMLCAGGQMKDSCQGDSGGPLT